jgi:hypothetical protein
MTVTQRFAFEAGQMLHVNWCRLRFFLQDFKVQERFTFMQAYSAGGTPYQN